MLARIPVLLSMQLAVGWAAGAAQAATLEFDGLEAYYDATVGSDRGPL